MSKTNQKKVSIVLPVYNGESNVANAIESVLRQTYRNFELIIVNDCSTDGTAAVLDRYASLDERIRIINNPVNLKLPRTLNAGFSHATGQYYTWTSDDNLYRKNAIERMVETLESNVDIDMVYADYTHIDEAGNPLKAMIAGQPETLLTTNPIGACFLYTSEIAQKAGEYDCNLFLAEDYDYWIRIWRAGKLYHLDEDLYEYRVHEGSLTATRRESVGIQTYKTLEKNFLFLYAVARTRKQRNALIDHMFYRLDGHDKSECRNMIARIDKSYVWHVRRKRIMGRVRKTALWGCLRKIKRKLRQTK